MRGVSEVIAIILILMITISLAGLAYMFMSTTMSDVTSSAGSTVDTTTSSMLTSFTIESMDVAKVYVRNTGQNALTSLSVYVNDEPATYNVTTPIAAGAVGTITIYSFIPDGATVKVTSPDGFSASKVANPCEKAKACWKFEEGVGTTAYDSSSTNHYTWTLTNGPAWVTGKSGIALSFDGSNDYATSYGVEPVFSYPMSITMWMKANNATQTGHILYGGEYPNAGDGWGGENETHISLIAGGVSNITLWSQTTSTTNAANNLISPSDTNWHYLVVVIDSICRYYVDGVLVGSGAIIGTPNYSTYRYYSIGRPSGDTRYFNGIVDEIRIFNRAIY